jgi:DNA-binding transcriptional LysR family regulator
MLTLRHIEVFTCIMRTGSVTEAAKELHISQPAVSKTLQHAESRLGITLFKRLNGRLQATPEAKHLFSAAHKIEDSLSQFNQVSRDLKNLKVGQINITVAPALALNIIPDAVGMLKQSWPHLSVHIDVQPNASIQEQIQYDRADLGIVHFPSDSGNIIGEVIRVGEIKCVVPKAHHLSTFTSITESDLYDSTIIYCAGGAWWQELIASNVSALTNTHTRLQVNYFSVACQLANKGLGIALVDEFSIPTDSLENTVIIPFFPKISIDFGILYNTHNALSKPVEEFIHILKELVNN